MGTLGLELSESKDTVRRYVCTHTDASRGLFFHPVLLEKLHKSKGEYSFEDYVAELKSLYGQEYDSDAWKSVSAGKLMRKDAKFKVYLGLAKDEESDPADKVCDVGNRSEDLSTRTCHR